MKQKFFLLSALLIGILFFSPIKKIKAASDIKIELDGNIIDMPQKAIIKSGRTLVPIRFLAEAQGAEVDWDAENGFISIKKDAREFKMKIGSRLIRKSDSSFFLNDVAPEIINKRTYVPLRAAANLLGIAIDYDNAKRTVMMNSAAAYEAPVSVDILNLSANEDISTLKAVKAQLSEELRLKAAKIKLLTLDSVKYDGYIEDMSSDLNKELTYLPSSKDVGEKIMFLGVYDKDNKLIDGAAKLVKINPQYRITFKGVENGASYNDEVNIIPDINFKAVRLDANIINLTTSKTQNITNLDPEGEFKFKPDYLASGPYSISLSAYDEDGNEHKGETKNFTINVAPHIELSGLPKDGFIDGPVVLSTKRNFDVLSTEYVMYDKVTGNESIIKSLPYGSCTFFPNVDMQGLKEIFVRCTDSAGIKRESERHLVTIKGNSKLLLQGIGPNAVITGDVKLNALSNMPVQSVDYFIVDKNKNERMIAENVPYQKEFVFTPSESDAGNVSIYAKGNLSEGIIKSDAVSFRIYLGKIYSKKALMSKQDFFEFAKKNALKEYLRTDMAASITAAQAILETGWGQSVPVDKYDGKFSNNLFGIKGSSSNGSVTITTSEVYNNVKYTIDDKFRAYKDPYESFKDHTDFLLRKERYQPFRNVMFDAVRGSFAIRRSGYATDPSYSYKLIEIINKNNLLDLDKLSI